MTPEAPEDVFEIAARLMGLVTPADVLEETCRIASSAAGAPLVSARWSPSTRWTETVHACSTGEPGQPMISALFGVHRRIAISTGPVALPRTSETGAIYRAFSDAARQEIGRITAYPIASRTRRNAGEVVVAFSTGEEPDGDAGLRNLVGFASHALENAYRLAFARREQERLHLLAEASDEALWDWQISTDEMWWGGGIQKLLGSDGFVEAGFAWKMKVIDPEDRDRVAASFEEALKFRTVWGEEYRIRRPDGRVLHVEDRAYLLRHATGRPYRVVGTIRDVSAMKTLLIRNQEARAEAESANRAKDEFLAILGHELRNPLAPIITALELLRLRPVPEIEKERKILERQARHMIRLVDDLLDISRIMSGKLKLQRERLDLRDVVSSATEMIRPVLEERGIGLSVDVETGLLLEGDAARLTQVVSNLLSNAVRYSTPAGRVEVTGRRDGNRIVLSVADTGVGISSEMLPRVFDLFVQEKQSIDRAQGGLGLGLSIVRSLVALHGGEVSASSDGRGKGSTFRVRLPTLRRAHEDALSPDAAVDPPVPAVKVLIVDDNVDAGDLLAESLSLNGHRTEIARDGREAIDRVETFEPDLILLDIGLPVMNGYDVARAIRSSGRRDVRIVAVTGYGLESDQHQAREAGFDAHLVKPVSLDRLTAMIRELTRADRSA